ncbi:hypothetical protein G7Z12_37175 [Streptomyces sp. ID38640]|uniref:hypothetical protein n=1 Tax=Streptomyces sp. ID38640 TaxID=1265399 RepID=UPI00140F003E|nr:hypothetical protein [Streptomyces sp. ID38640]QIK10857.1 hypothetical protein G7Z12_37175 [Streptomyces sp. ID38640]
MDADLLHPVGEVAAEQVGVATAAGLDPYADHRPHVCPLQQLNQLLLVRGALAEGDQLQASV